MRNAVKRLHGLHSRDRTPLALLVLAVLISCSKPRIVVGSGDPDHLASLATAPVSAQFTETHLTTLHKTVAGPAFRKELQKYTCGEPVPKFDLTSVLYLEGPHQERLVHLYTQPALVSATSDLCFALGFQYEVNRSLRTLDTGAPMVYQLNDGRTKPKTITASRPLLRRPVCDCARRYSGDTAWVDLIDED